MWSPGRAARASAKPKAPARRPRGRQLAARHRPAPPATISPAARCRHGALPYRSPRLAPSDRDVARAPTDRRRAQDGMRARARRVASTEGSARERGRPRRRAISSGAHVRCDRAHDPARPPAPRRRALSARRPTRRHAVCSDPPPPGRSTAAAGSGCREARDPGNHVAPAGVPPAMRAPARRQ